MTKSEIVEVKLPFTAQVFGGPEDCEDPNSNDKHPEERRKSIDHQHVVKSGSGAAVRGDGGVNCCCQRPCGVRYTSECNRYPARMFRKRLLVLFGATNEVFERGS